MRHLVTATIALAALMLLVLGRPSPGQASFTLVQQTEQSEYAFIGDVVVSPDGRFVYATAPYASAIDVLAKGPNIGLAGAALSGMATMQVLGSDGQTSQCWEARYSAPSVDQADRYSARSD